MFVIKRNGNREPVSFDKIHKRINWIIKEPKLLDINGSELTQLVIQGLTNNIKTSDIDVYTANLSASLSPNNPDYLTLASRVIINNHHKNTLNSFKDKVSIIYNKIDSTGKTLQLIDKMFYKFVIKNQQAIDKYINYERDYLFDFFGFKTIEKGYLLAMDNKIIERPQDLFMRVAIQIHIPKDTSLFKNEEVLKKIFNTYDRLSYQYYTHATPTLFNSGSTRPQLASCFLLGSHDSLEGIMKTLYDSVNISKWSGGIGIHVSMWRGEGSLIRGTNGKSSGIIPFLKMFNDGAKAFNQGGKRNGSFAIYLEPHHPDIIKFLHLRRNSGDENLRCRDLFMALWISDLFMNRVKNDGDWHTFCPNKCPNLNTTWGEEYEKLYIQYEEYKLYEETYKARDIWKYVFESQKESGMPYICYKDTVNRYSMQNNIGTIQSSNLCSEIVLYSDTNETSVCNLASICLSKFVEDSYTNEEMLNENKRELDHEFPKNPKFNYKLLATIASELTENLNNVIDKNWYPTISAARSNLKHRPIGIGVQGLADVFMKFRIPFDSVEASIINKKIAEAIYYGALSKSTEICRKIYQEVVSQFNNEKNEFEYKFPFSKEIIKSFPELKKENNSIIITKIEDIPKDIGAYITYNLKEGSPLKSKFHWELYGLDKKDLSQIFDWETLRNHINIYGIRNSMTTAYMPTASTSQIMGCSSCFEPYVSNIFKRKTLAGDFIIINKYLMKDLNELGLWNSEIKNYLLSNNGSIQNIAGIPDNMKNIYKTIWEIKQKVIIDLASDRQPFIDQSQSMNLHLEKFTFDIFNSMQFYAWTKKLKTGSYYLRTRPAVSPQKFTIDPEFQKKIIEKYEIVNYKDNDEEEEICLMCSS